MYFFMDCPQFLFFGDVVLNSIIRRAHVEQIGELLQLLSRWTSWRWLSRTWNDFIRGFKNNFGDNISSFPFFLPHPANDYFLLFLVSRGCSADNMQIQRMCEIISRLSNVWGFAHTQMEPFGNFIQHFRFLFMHKCSLSQYGQTEVVATNVIKSIESNCQVHIWQCCYLI